MRILYLDCTTGVSGDMLLAALLDTGISADFLRSELGKLGLDCFKVATRKTKVAGISTRRVGVKQTKEQPLRTLSDIIPLLDTSILDEPVKLRSQRMFQALAKAEAKVHATTPDKVHFHEIGAVDTLVDIVGAAALIEHINPDRIYCSAVNLGTGFVKIAHGTLPVPAPAVAELGRGMKTFATDSGTELATPTGMAIVKCTVHGFTTLPLGSIQTIGYGSGTKSSDELPTYVRAYIIDQTERDTFVFEQAEETFILEAEEG